MDYITDFFIVWENDIASFFFKKRVRITGVSFKENDGTGNFTGIGMRTLPWSCHRSIISCREAPEERAESGLNETIKIS